MRITKISATPVRVAVLHAPYATERAGSKFHWGLFQALFCLFLIVQ